MDLPPDFKDLLAPFDVAALDGETSTIYGLTEDLRLGYVNPAWHAFARANGALNSDGVWNAGLPIMDATPAPLRLAYQRLFDRARTDHVVVEHEYECSSPTSFRWFRMRVHPCDSGAFLVVNILLRTSDHVRPSMSAIDAIYRNGEGLIAQCSHCRCVRRNGPPASWDWVPDYVETPPSGISHSICGVCFDYHYPPDV
ncbi:MAG: hypothetical protein SGI86_01565 [Deltaproteobacteria bacterium]|nr:hypothetical protein [Deltaproteobacteria bacterium]